MKTAHLVMSVAVASVLLGAWSASSAQSASPNPAHGFNHVDPNQEAVILVATDDVEDPIYSNAVLIVKPASQGMHVGIILNKPTPFSLATLFPEHSPSKNVQENVYFGGPMTSTAVAAVTPHTPAGDKGIIEFNKELYMVLQSETIDTIIETTPNEARYYVGNVIWQPGELASELKRGFWHVMPVSKDIVFRKNTRGLWKALKDETKTLYTGVFPSLVLKTAAKNPAKPS